jgi:4-hydroxy-tetrahydrodipicolinate synthase
MIRTNEPPFGRLLTAMVTPFDEQLRIDVAALGKLTEHLIATGTKTIVVAGTTGESPTLDEAETLSLMKEVIKVSAGRARIILGTGSNCTAKAVKMSKEAEQSGADGVLVVAPYYNKPSQAGMIKHFEEVSKAVHIPIIVYNIPGRTGVNIQSETIVEIAQSCPNIHAVKESSGNVDQVAEIAANAREEFRIYSGDDYLTLPFLSVGTSGVVSVASHLAGKRIERMMASFFEGKLDEARKLHYELLPLFKGLFAAPSPSCTKYALSKLGLCKEFMRLPMVPLDSSQKAAMDKVLQQCGIGAELARA